MSEPRRLLLDCPDGPLGTRYILYLMAKLVRESRSDPTIRALAEKIIGHLPGKNYRRQAEAVHNWVRANIRYVGDPDGLEMIRAPIRTLEAGNGDCDDMVILEAALLMSISHPVRFVAISTELDCFSHVYLQTLIGQDWVSSDPTEPYPFGWQPEEGVLQRMTVNV